VGLSDLLEDEGTKRTDTSMDAVGCESSARDIPFSWVEAVYMLDVSRLTNTVLQQDVETA